MDRRTFLKSSGAATVGGLTTAGAAHAEHATETGTVRTLSLSSTSSIANDETALIIRRFSESLEAATDAALTVRSESDINASDITLASVADHLNANAAWSTFLPLINGFDHAELSGWIATGGGSVILDQLETETQQRILFVGAQPAPFGLWADRELMGLHPRPSLTVTSHDQTIISHSERGTGNVTCHLSAGLVMDMEHDRLSAFVLHALPKTLAGAPLVMTMPLATWSSLPQAHRGVLEALAEASLARSVIENEIANRAATGALPLPTPLPLPAEFQVALSAGVEAERIRLSTLSDLAASSFASQAAFRSLTRAGDIVRKTSPLLS